MRTVTRIAVAMLSLFLSGAVVGSSAPAHATDYYRYWSYFQVADGAYVASEKGVGATIPEDGSVDGYRFAAPDPKAPNLPRLDLGEVTFDAVCGDSPEADGKKRVAVLIDFGADEDAEGQEVPDPHAWCAVVPTKATGLQVLQSVADARTKPSSFGPLLCGIEGYPSEGCADVVTKTASPADAGFVTIALDTPVDDVGSESDSGDGSNTPLYVGLGAVVLGLLAGGVFVSRRNKTV